jgi:protein-S-isoprenylcysteine O-methyltransferase Ste14
MSKKSAFLVMLQIAAMVFLVIYNKPIIFGYGLLFQIFGIVVGIWAIYAIRIGNFNIQPEVKSNILIKKGPYKWIRNPMYLSVILFFLPIVIRNSEWINIIAFGVLLTVLILKILLEESFLKSRFGEEYLNYKSKTKRLIPYLI